MIIPGVCKQSDSLPSDGPQADAQPEIDEAPPASKSGDSENLVWNYFQRAANRLLCKNCPRSFISSLSLKSARKHLKVKHPEDFSILLSAEATVRKINKGCAEKEGKSGNDHFSDQERGFTTVFLERAQKGILASSSGVRDKIFRVWPFLQFYHFLLKNWPWPLIEEDMVSLVPSSNSLVSWRTF